MSPVNVLDVSGQYTPTLLVGEKVAKPDEGAFASRDRFAGRNFMPAALHHTPHPPSAPSPLEKHEGRRRSIGGLRQAIRR